MGAVFNIKETLLPDIRVGTRMWSYVPALARDVELVVTYISAQADFATWSATAHAGRVRYPDIRCESETGRRTGAAARYERTGGLG